MKSFKNNKIVLVFLTIFLGILLCSPFLVSYSYTGKDNEPDIKVSIVVPVYNTEKYLDECLESLENQTLKEIEILCVNDGSKDNSLQILENHASKDKRVKVINQKNSGVCVARNNGILAASGEYVIFCDSDDLIPPYAYEKAYLDAVNYNVNVVGLKIMTFKEGEETVDLSSFQYDPSKVKRRGRQRGQNPFYYMLENSGYVVNKLFKRSFLMRHNLLFKEGVTNYEDALFNFMAFPFVTEMVQDDNIFYCYRTNRPNSAATAFNARKVLKSTLKVTDELFNNRERFNFRKGDEWILDKVMDLNYNHITKDTSDSEDKKYYSSVLVEKIDNYLNKYNIIPSKGNQNRIEELRAIAQEK